MNETPAPKNNPRGRRHTITRVTRHPVTQARSQSGKRAFPDEVTFDGGFSLGRVQSLAHSMFVPLLNIEPYMFDRCPICLTPGRGTREDVPPKSVGGTVLTNTCKRCNNSLGSTIDTHLTACLRDELILHLSVEGVPGTRRLGYLPIRVTPDGKPATLVDHTRVPPEALVAIESGQAVNLVPEEPDGERVQLAVLKSAYLAACAATQSIPDTPQAKAIREDLRAARSLKRGQQPNVRTRVDFRGSPGQEHEDGNRNQLLLAMDGQTVINLSGVLLVQWDFPSSHNLSIHLTHV